MIRPERRSLLQCLGPVRRRADDLHVPLGGDKLRQLSAELAVRVGGEYTNLSFHNVNPPMLR